MLPVASELVLLPHCCKSAVQDLRNLLLKNGYPQGIITYNVNGVLNGHKKEARHPCSDSSLKNVVILLPYLGLHSNQITKRLKSCVYNFYSFVSQPQDHF